MLTRFRAGICYESGFIKFRDFIPASALCGQRRLPESDNKRAMCQIWQSRGTVQTSNSGNLWPDSSKINSKVAISENCHEYGSNFFRS